MKNDQVHCIKISVSARPEARTFTPRSRSPTRRVSLPTPRLEYLPDRPRTRGTVPEEVEVSYFDLYNGHTFNVRKKRWID